MYLYVRTLKFIFISQIKMSIKKSNLTFPGPRISNDKDGVTYSHELLQLHHLTKGEVVKRGLFNALPFFMVGINRSISNLEYKRLLGLQSKIQRGLSDGLFKFKISLSVYFHAWEQISQQSQEDGHILCHNFRHVEVPQRTHQHLGISVASCIRKCFFLIRQSDIQ